MKSTIVLYTIIFSLMTLGFAQAQPDSTETKTAVPPEIPEIPEIAQIPETESETDTIVITLGKNHMIIIKQEDGTNNVKFENAKHDHGNDDSRREGITVDAFALDLGVTNYFVDGNFGTDAATPDLELKVFRPGSHVALHFLPVTASLAGKGKLNLKTALTIDYSNYYWEQPITIQPNKDVFTYSLPADSVAPNFKKNKLVTRYFQIPLMLNFTSKPGTEDGFKISVGVYGGVLWQGKTKQKSDENGLVKVKDDFNLNPLKYGITARVSIEWFDLYVNYNLSELFADGEGPSTQLFTAGVNVVEF